MATVTRTLLTAEEFLKRDLSSGNFELVRGEVVKLPPAMPEHGMICSNSVQILGGFGRHSGYGYVLCNDTAIQTERGPDTVRGADVAFYSHARWPRSEVGRQLPPVAPDVVVEVYSPGNRPSQMRAKVNEYLDAGALMVWLLHPSKRTLALYRPDEPIPIVLTEDQVLEGLPELPGFHCRVADFFS